MQGLATIKAQNQVRVGQIADVQQKALQAVVDYFDGEGEEEPTFETLRGEVVNALALYREWKEVNPVT
jgi:hypothetical protein